MGHTEKARDLFLEGYNCAQAVLCAFSDITGIDENMSLKIASSLGAGIGGAREVCGAVNAGAIVLGCLYGYVTPDNLSEKKEHYARVSEFLDAFKNEYGTILCRELLSGLKLMNTPSERTPEYYKTRPCTRIVESVARLLDSKIDL